MKTKMGRPVLPKGEAKTLLVAARFTASEGKRIDAAIKRAKQDKPEWVRNTLLSAAGDATVLS